MKEKGTEKVKIRGLVRAGGWIFCIWGGIVAAKGLLDSLFLEPESNYYSLKPWEFVTYEQWQKWASFEMVYGTACLVVGFLLFEFSKRVKEFILRPKEPPEFDI